MNKCLLEYNRASRTSRSANREEEERLGVHVRESAADGTSSSGRRREGSKKYSILVLPVIRSTVRRWGGWEEGGVVVAMVVLFHG